MKKLIAIFLILVLAPLALAAGPWILEIPPLPSGSFTATFYYVTGMPTGTVATYTATLPPWFTGTGGVAAAPDPTGVNGFKLPLPANWPSAGTMPSLSGTIVACNGSGCSLPIPFGPPGAPNPAGVLIGQ